MQTDFTTPIGCSKFSDILWADIVERLVSTLTSSGAKVKPKIHIQINKFLVCSGISSWRGGRDSTKIMILVQACLKDQDRVVLSKWGEIAAFGIIVSELEKYHVPLLFLFF